MEAIATFGLAASVLQVVDFSMTLLSSAHEVVKNGSTVRNFEINKIVVDLQALNDELKTSCGSPGVATPSSKDDQDLKSLAEDCSAVAGELLAMLSKCMVNEKSGRRKTLRAAIESIWKKDRIDETETRLEAIRNQLQFRIIVSMKASLDVIDLRGNDLQTFDEPKRKIIEAIHDSNADLQAATSRQTTELLRRQDGSESLAEQRHRQIMFELSSTQTRYIPVTVQQIQKEILDRLNFSRMVDRHDTIQPRHKQTFDWILAEDSTSTTSKSDFARWLCTGDGIYWISGKAGSGKSTLMKFIRNDARTSQSLSTWAKGKPLAIASFYFWKAGTSLQKTQVGLFRSLLHSVLDQCPDLSQVLFPWRYLGQRFDDSPTFSELKRAFELLASQDTVKVALFIDGLDEYEGAEASMLELSRLLEACVSASHVKAVVSSRPVNVFEVAFRSNPKLRLHELTGSDIVDYVDDRLARDPQMLHLKEIDPRGSEELVKEIVDTSSGVFLWVTLVVGSLLRGLNACDFIPDLQHRLRELPGELEDLFRHMISRIDPRYRMQSAQYFQIVRQYKGIPLTIGAEKTPLPLTLQMFTDAEYYTTTSRTLHLSKAKMIKRRQDTTTRLRVRCVGLVEVANRHSQELKTPWIDKSNVDYLHRSVLDFLERPAVCEDIIAQTHRTNFDACLVLMRVSLGLIKSVTWQNFQSIVDLINWHVRLVQEVRPCNRRSSVRLLDDLDSIMSDHCTSYRQANEEEWRAFTNGRFENTHWFTLWPWTIIKSQGDYYEHRKQPNGYRVSFLSFAARSNLICYVKEKLGEDGHGQSNQEKAELLVFACDRSDSPVCERNLKLSMPMIDLLLQRGADPNYGLVDSSPWQHVLYSIMDTYRREELPIWVPVIKSFLSHGADIQVYVGRNSAVRGSIRDHNWHYSALFVIKRIFFHELEDKMRGTGWYDCWTRREPSRGKPVRANNIGTELVQLMEEKGAKAEVWRLVKKMDKPVWEQVFPLPLHGKSKFRRSTWFSEQKQIRPPSAAVEQPEGKRARFKKLLSWREK